MFKYFKHAGIIAGAALLLSACGGGAGSRAPGAVPQSVDGAQRAIHTVGAQTRYTPPISTVNDAANLGQFAGGFDGNMYFAEEQSATNCTTCSGRISKITTSGSITSYTLQQFTDDNNVSHPVRPYALMTTSDSKVWFVSKDGYFGSINTDGSSPTVYSLHSLGSDASGTFDAITQGTDGNFYLAESTPDRVIKVTSGGTPSVFCSSFSSGADLGMIFLNGDANFWLTERGTGKIAKLTSGGTLTEYNATSGGGYDPFDMATDGSNLWYTAQAVSPSTGTLLVEMKNDGTILHSYTITTAPAGEGAIALQGVSYAWVINANISRVRQSTGVVNDYTLTSSDPNTVAGGMIPGTDGNFWFTDRAHNKIVKVSKT